MNYITPSPNEAMEQSASSCTNDFKAPGTTALLDGRVSRHPSASLPYQVRKLSNLSLTKA
jgi:hypothetical protein